MSTEKIYPKGIMVFPPHEKAPSFVKGDVIISPNILFAWLKENAELLSDYKGEKQLKLQLLEGNKGLYLNVLTYQKKNEQLNTPSKSDDFPF